MSEGIDQNNLEDKPAPRTDVWPPPPTSTPDVTQSYALTFIFAPVQLLARAIIVLLSIDCLLSVYAVLSALPSSSQAGVNVPATSAAIFQAMLPLATGVCFFVWMYRMDKNLRAFGAEELQFQPRWAVGYFFVPIMNFYRPYQAMSEIWQASDPDPKARTKDGRHPIHPPPLLGFWWGCWLLWSIIDEIANQTSAGSAFDTVSAAFRLVAAILAILVVHLYTKRQQGTARHLALIP